MMDAIRHSRRSFLGAAAAGIATAGMARMGTVPANASDAQGFSQRFAPVRQIRAGVLDIGYYETGSADGPPVLLLHGFPYSVDSYVEVAPMLAEHGCRVIVPYLRGHGSESVRRRVVPADADRDATLRRMRADAREGSRLCLWPSPTATGSAAYGHRLHTRQHFVSLVGCFQ